MVDLLFSIDLDKLFFPSHSIPEMFIRGTMVYLLLVILMRAIQKRHIGMLSGADFLFIVLIAASSHYALTGGDISITTGIGVILTIVFWNFVINWLSFHFKFFKNLLVSPPIPLIYEGKILRRNLHREFITEEELLTEMRKQGISNLGEVEKANIESDGEFSFVLKEKKKPTMQRKKMI